MLVVADPTGAPVDGADCERLGLPPGHAARVRLAVVSDGEVGLREVAARTLPLTAALPALLAVHDSGGPAFRRLPDSLRAWALATRLALRLVAAHRMVPTLTRAGGAGTAAADPGAGERPVVATWRALVDDDPEVAAALARLAAALPPAARSVALDGHRLYEPGALLRAFADAVADTAARQAAPPPRPGRPRARLLPGTARWAEARAAPGAAGVRRGAAGAGGGAGGGGGRGGGCGGAGGAAGGARRAPAGQGDPWPLRFFLRTTDGALLPAADVWAAAADADAVALQEALLRGLGRCARVFAPLDRALREAEPAAVDLDAAEAYAFICDAEPVLRGADVVVVLPPDVAEEDVRLRLRVGAGEDAAPGTDAGTDEAALGDTAGYAWEVVLGDEALADWELAALADARSPLLRWRDRWVRLDPAQIARLRSLGPGGRLSLGEALAFGLGGTTTVAEVTGEQGAARGERVEVVADGRVADLLDRLRGAADRPEVATSPEGFVGELRPYQRRGVAWLQGMGELGLGAVLADDMGLGKGIQLIAYLLALHRAGSRELPCLVVCPTSVVGNWQREIARFAPGLAVTRWHGADRPEQIAGVRGVVLTTYGTLRRDVERLAETAWDVVTLDEAQHVKNPQTAGAKAVRRLRRRQTVALTGTPLENRLAELWSLLDVTTPGLLGPRASFTRRFVVPVETHHDRATATRLRRLVAPFVLRREKSDPAVIADLPPKIERTVPCPLTAEQAQLYAAAVDRVLGSGALDGTSAMERRGRVLALLTALKQICNHPSQYLREDATALPGRSGKLAAAREIIGEAVDAGDRVLVFTQYVAMGRLLVAQLGADLGVEVPFLHGGVPAPARDRLVAGFQAGMDGTVGEGPPVLVISLRAGGTGLNLTAATHVVHYDRWWNPAVEDQATDRAHRIGQRRTVEVHKLVTAGTVEERIDELLTSKRALAEQVVGAGESWVTELGDDELRDLVALSAQASIAELDEDDAGLPALAGVR